jgi:putative peptidoglycan lipid II flippase
MKPVMDERGRVTRAAGVVGFFTLLSRLMGLLRDIVIAFLFGAHGTADAFFVAFRIPNLLRRLTAEGALTAGFVPIFTDYLSRQGKEEAMRFARVVTTFAVVFLGALTILGIFLAAPITYLFAPGFLAEEGKFTFTVYLTRLMFPYILFVSLVALAMGFLNSMCHFMAPALSPILLNLSMVVCALLISPFLSEPAVSLAYGVLLGGVAQLVLQIPFLRRYGFSFSFDFGFGHPALGRLLALMGPALVGAAVYQINVLVGTMLASVLQEGSVASLYYADRLLQFPLGIFAVALATAALPTFSSLAAREDFKGLRDVLSYSLRLVNFISLPATFGLMVVSVPVFSILFQRGAFDTDATLRAARALVYFSIGLWGMSGTRVGVAAFHAMKDMKTPVKVAFCSFVLNFLLSLVLMGEVSADPASSGLTHAIAALSSSLGFFSLSYAGLALANSISSTFNFFALLLILYYRLGQLPWTELIVSFVRNLFSAMLMAFPLLWIVGRVDWVGPERILWLNGVWLLLILVLGPLIYLGSSFLLKSPERGILRQLGAQLRQRTAR